MAWYDHIIDAFEGRSGPGVVSERTNRSADPTGQPISTLTDAELLAKYSFDASQPSMDDRFETPTGKLITNKDGGAFSTTGREVLKDYYGDELDAEIAKAKAYAELPWEEQESALPKMKQKPAGLRYKAGGGGQEAFYISHDAIDQPVSVYVQPDAASNIQAHYSGGQITLQNPEFTRKNNSNLVAAHARKPQTYNGQPFELPEEAREGAAQMAQEFLDANNKRIEDVVREAANPIADAREVLEHEVGHHFTRAGKEPAPGLGHIGSNADELSNALGKIQRDTYVLFGQRFETPSQFEDYLEIEERKPDKERFKGYSTEAKRGLRAIIENMEPRAGYDMWRQAVEAIPKFVTSDPKPEPTFDDYLDYWKSRPVAS
jgi:hypothetical protein